MFLKKREFKDVKGPLDFIKYFFQDVVLTKHGRCLRPARVCCSIVMEVWRITQTIGRSVSAGSNTLAVP